jgi:uncharacterized protein
MFIACAVLCMVDTDARSETIHPSQMETATLTITTQSTQVPFTVEVAHTSATQAKGLMFRTSLAEHAGMLFQYSLPPRVIRMWMRNTLIPLDMLFIDERGTIVHIHENAQPRDETVISSRYNITSALELNGGMVKKYGISVGDTVSLKP